MADNLYYRDMLLKHDTQAFAELSTKDVYLVIYNKKVTDSQNWDTNTACGGKTSMLCYPSLQIC